jgi:hypothetical protein
LKTLIRRRGLSNFSKLKVKPNAVGVVDLSAQKIYEAVRSDVISRLILMTVTAFGVVAFVNSGDVTAKAMLGLEPLEITRPAGRTAAHWSQLTQA